MPDPNPRTLSVEVTPEPIHPAWDDFLAGLPTASIEQSCGWARHKESEGWRARLIRVFGDAELLGGALLLTRRLGPLGQIGYVSRGPVYRDDEAVASAVFRAVDDTARQLRLLWTVVAPPFHDTRAGERLRGLGYFVKPDPLPPSRLVVATLVIDLHPPLDEILGRMRMTTRQNIRRALRKGFLSRPGNREDIERFWNQMHAVCLRRGVPPQPARPETFFRLWDRFAPAGHVRLLLGCVADRVIAGAFAFTFGGSYRVWKIGWSGEEGALRPMYPMFYEAIRDAQTSRFREFDFVQILPEHARALERGETVDDAYWGVTDFKVGFGGRLLFAPDPVYRSHNALGQWLLRCGGARWLAHPRVIARLNRLARNQAQPD